MHIQVTVYSKQTLLTFKIENIYYMSNLDTFLQLVTFSLDKFVVDSLSYSK